MAVTRVSQSTVKQGLDKSRSFIAGLELDKSNFYGIETVTVTSASQASISFTNIPQNYQHLHIRGISRGPTGHTISNARLKYNGDTGYQGVWMRNQSNSLSVGGYGSASNGVLFQFTISNSASAGIYTAFTLDILDYSSNTNRKTVETHHGHAVYDNTYGVMGRGIYQNVTASVSLISPITSMIFDNWNGPWTQHTTISLYGIGDR